MKKLIPLIIVVVIGVFFIDTVHAGFGITPPYVRNSSLTRNSVYEQTILLVRNNPTTPLKAEISIDVPGINEWFTVNEGLEFELPQGEEKVSMTIRVVVPDKAKFENYTGRIKVRTSAPDNLPAGSVSIALGAQIDVDITVIDREIKDFRVRKIGISDLNEGHKVGWLYFPGKIHFTMLIENTGNIDVSPSRITFKLYDSTGQVLLEETEHTNRIKNIKPFKTEEVLAEIPTRLPAGSYIGRYEIFNSDENKQNGELTVSILPYGTLQAAGYGFMGLSIAHKLSVLLPTFVMLAGIVSIILYLRQRKLGGRSRHTTTKA